MAYITSYIRGYMEICFHRDALVQGGQAALQGLKDSVVQHVQPFLESALNGHFIADQESRQLLKECAEVFIAAEIPFLESGIPVTHEGTSKQ